MNSLKSLENLFYRSFSREGDANWLSINGDVYVEGFKNSDIGFNTVRALDDNDLIDKKAFEFLPSDKSCSFIYEDGGRTYSQRKAVWFIPL